jgi:hypothetical protein
MQRTILVALALLLSGSGITRAGEPAKLNVPPAGFTALFNGQDLTNWKADAKQAEHWKVVDGVLTYDGKANSLTTEKDYGNFILCVDWKIAKGGDSGVYLRGQPQVQIWDNKEGSGALWNNKAPNNKPLVFADNPVGEWNTFKIQLVGEKVTVHLNDKLVVDNLAMETLKGRKKGPILLQHHGSPLWFRNTYIKELPDDAAAK